MRYKIKTNKTGEISQRLKRLCWEDFSPTKGHLNGFCSKEIFKSMKTVKRKIK